MQQGDNMSITFSAYNPETHTGAGPDMNLCNSNAYDLMNYLGLEIDCCGNHDASDLAARCRRKLWDESRNHDPALPVVVEGRMTYCGRPEGYLRSKCEFLLEVAEYAIKHDMEVSWG
jgi:hypothetical protein